MIPSKGHYIHEALGYFSNATVHTFIGRLLFFQATLIGHFVLSLMESTIVTIRIIRQKKYTK
jgi:hypothetical protein